MKLLLLTSLTGITLIAQDGAALYQKRCATCHDAPAERVPTFNSLRAMDPSRIERALTSGSMKTQAEGLTSTERYALVGYIATSAGKAPGPPPATAFCASGGTPFDGGKGPQWNGWSPDPANSRFQSAAGAGLAATDVPKLKLKWAFGLGAGTEARAGISIAGGRLFAGSQTNAVYSLDARTGCIHWSFEAEGPVTSAISIGPAGVYFGDSRANVYGLDSPTGRLLWKVRVEEHFAARVTGAPVLQGGVLYVPVASFEEAMPASPTFECCTFRGSVVALDAATGKRAWKTYTIADPPQPTKKSKSGAQFHGPSGASVWSAPTYDEKHDVFYVGTGNNYSDPPTLTSDAVLALDRKTGKILWSRQLTPNDANNMACAIPPKTNCPDSDGPDFDFGQPPILVRLADGKRALVIGQKSGVAYGLDPDRKGEILWQTRVGKGGMLGGIQWGSAADSDRMYVALSDVKLKPVLDSSSPRGFSLDLDPKTGGGLFALRLANGEKAWTAVPPVCDGRKHCSPAQSGAVSAIPGAVFSGSLDGHLRAYSSSTGEVLWDFDTAREYDAVNGQKAHGGSLDGPGPVIAGGMVYVNSGYGQWGGVPGNVLLAFSVEK